MKKERPSRLALWPPQYVVALSLLILCVAVQRVEHATVHE